MAPKMLLDRITFRRKTAPTSPAHLSVLDLPVAEYNPATGLPLSIQVGGRSVRPFVSIQQVRDHLTLLAAFHGLSTRSGQRFHRVADSAAFDYERWASTVLPARARRTRSASSDSATPSGASMTRTGTWSPPESPLSEVSSAASSTSPPSSLFTPLAPHELPPLPVLMSWHAHLLNPAQFALDADGTYAWLHAIPFPLEAAAEAVRTGTLPTEIQHVPASNDLRPIPSISGWTPPDISAAVQRLTRRSATLSELGWLDEEYITGDAAPLASAIVRYHAWLDLMAAIHTQPHGHPFLAPTFDIMLAWATHQLHGTRYRADTARVLGEELDRAIDRAEQDPESLKRAGTLWKARYKHEYVQRRPPVRRSTV